MTSNRLLKGSHQLRQEELDVGRRRVGRRHVEVHAANVLREGRRERSRDERTPVTTLGVEGLVAEPLHQIGEDPGAVAEVEALLGGRRGEPVARQRGSDNLEDEILIGPLKKIVTFVTRGTQKSRMSSD